MSYLERGRACALDGTRVNRIADSDPPEVGYLLIMATRADRSMGEKLD